jgi:hypothetical protein
MGVLLHDLRDDAPHGGPLSRREVGLAALRVRREEEEGYPIAVVVVNDSRPTALPATTRSPADLADATRTGNENPGCRVVGDVSNELLVLVVLQASRGILDERPSLHHGDVVSGHQRNR